MLRDTIKAAQVTAMKAGDKPRLAAVRLILAKLKDKDIELRTAANVPDDDVLVTDVLQKMAKQRRESITLYEQGGRQELAEVEKAELAVIEEFLPQPDGRGRSEGRHRRDHRRSGRGRHEGHGQGCRPRSRRSTGRRSTWARPAGLLRRRWLDDPYPAMVG
jgi:uncharacterized protein YqeY